MNWFSDFKDLGLSSLPGQLSLNFYFNWLNYYSTQFNAQSPFVDFSGSGGDGTFTQGIAQPLFRYKTNTTVGYAVGPASLSLRWQHMPSVVSAGSISSPTNPNNAFPTNAYDVFDLSGTWKITSAYILRAGVENLFDRQPEITGRTPGVGSPASSGQGSTYLGVYDILGRRFYVGLKARF